MLFEPLRDAFSYSINNDESFSESSGQFSGASPAVVSTQVSFLSLLNHLMALLAVLSPQVIHSTPAYLLVNFLSLVSCLSLTSRLVSLKHW